MTKSNDLTQGKVSRMLLGFFFPMLLTNLLQQFYSFADTAIVGKALGDNALGAVGNMSPLTFLIIGFATGITNGFSVIIGQSFGSGDMPAMRKYIASSIRLALILSAVLTLLSTTMLRRVLIFMNTDPVILEDSLKYGYIVFGGMTATMAYNLCSGILRALGDSKTPFYAIIIAAVINVSLDSFLLFVMKAGVGSAAVATIAAQLISVSICVSHLRRAKIINLSAKDFKPNLSLSFTLLKNGVPMACMNSVTAVGCMIVQTYVNALGVVYTSAYSACSRYLNLFMLPAVTAGYSVSSFTSQNYGARKFDRIRAGVRFGLIIGIISYFTLGMALITFSKPLAGFLLSGSQSVELAAGFLRICGRMFLALNFLFVFRSAVQGMGKPLVPMLSGVLEMALRIAVIVVFLSRIGYNATACAEISAWVGALLMNFTAYWVLIRRGRKSGEAAETAV